MNAEEEARVAENFLALEALIDSIQPPEDVTETVHQTITEMHGMESPEFIRGYLAGAMDAGTNFPIPCTAYATAAGKLIRGYDLRTGRPKVAYMVTRGAAPSNSEVVDL